MLSARDLVVRIGGSRILNGVSFEVREGERLGIIGPNGSGKTTLFNALSGFQPLARGEIHFRSQRIDQKPPHERARLGVGRVFQNFGIFRDMTLLENMLVSLEVVKPEAKAQTLRSEALELLRTINLENKGRDKASSLSGGQMRLLEIARVMACGSSLYLLDEPTAGVSPKMKREIETALRRILETNRTLLVIEHDMNFIQSLCDRILVMDAGRIVLDGTPAEIRNHPSLQELYFGASQPGHTG